MIFKDSEAQYNSINTRKNYHPGHSCFSTTRVPLLVIVILASATFRYVHPTLTLPSILPPRTHYQSQTVTLTTSQDKVPWFKCPDSPDTYCAFVDVPVDYLQPDNRSISLALRKYPASVPFIDKKGAIFLNPGGPGGSGTEEIARLGRDISAIVKGEMDIISFDPRGVNLTSPPLGCFRTEALAQLFQRDQEHLGLLYESRPLSSLSSPSSPLTPEELRWASNADSYILALDQTCVKRGNKDILLHSSTAATARDLKYLMEMVGEVKLKYWGFSYGTILGATFAAMFPDLVERFVLDGVSDSVSYASDFWQWGRVAVNHTYKTFDGFLSECASAGPSRCALATGTNDTLSSLHARILSLRERLHMTPLPVTNPSGTGVLTASSIQHAIFRGMYAPKGWPSLALAIAQAEKGNGTLLWERLNGWELAEKDPKENVFGRSMDRLGSGLLCHSIMCSETDPSVLTDTSPETLIRYVRDMGERSISGEPWSGWIAQCRYWSHHAKDVFRGPWTVATGFRKTNFPVLFVGMTADPATPLSAAQSMSQGFGAESASLLIQNGYGHCSIAQPSHCTGKAIRQYFLEGLVPEYGTICDSDPGYIYPESQIVPNDGVGLLEKGDDGQLRSALWRLSRAVHENSNALPLGI
ncbi:alpha/beta-hydrolase [Meredithblackwellia eburnea MCA 4105]